MIKTIFTAAAVAVAACALTANDGYSNPAEMAYTEAGCAYGNLMGTRQRPQHVNWQAIKNLSVTLCH